MIRIFWLLLCVGVLGTAFVTYAVAVHESTAVARGVVVRRVLRSAAIGGLVSVTISGALAFGVSTVLNDRARGTHHLSVGDARQDLSTLTRTEGRFPNYEYVLADGTRGSVSVFGDVNVVKGEKNELITVVKATRTADMRGWWPWGVPTEEIRSVSYVFTVVPTEQQSGRAPADR